MLWSFAYADWDTENQPDPDESREKLVNAAHKGAIYLLHSVSQTNADILGDVIDGISEKGYDFM
jgi:peptidoglycan-N-acetylmuramic acid deacetylase